MKINPKKPLTNATMSPAPELVVLETCHYSNIENITDRDYYLIKGDWMIEDLEWDGGYLLYKGKVVNCPVIQVMCGDFLELSEEEKEELEWLEDPDLMIRDRNGLFEGHTIDEISVEE